MSITVLCVLTRQVGSQTEPDQKVANLIGLISQDNIRSYIEDLADAGGHETRVSYTEGNRWAVDYIKETFESFEGLTSVTLDTFFITSATPPFNTAAQFNVVATLEGTEEPEKIYVVGGHLDATANLDANLNWDTDWPTAKARGADDNASGVAAILEIARVLSDPDNELNNRHTIEFVAFGAEERHPIYNNQNHLGSKHYVSQAFAASTDIQGAYILDMIGYNDTGNDYFNIVSDSRSNGLGVNMLEIKDAYDILLDSNSSPFPSPTYSDHDQFWLYRYQAILLIENAPPWQNNLPWYTANPRYHRESDSLATLNLSQITKVAKLTTATLAEATALVTSVTSEPDFLPETFDLLQNHPNPFNAGTVIRYRLATPGHIRLDVFNLQGRRVRRLVDEVQTPGEYSLVWDGKDAKGRDLSSGLFFYRLRAADQQFVRKMILSK